MKILTAAEMKQADEASIAAGVPIGQLMEAAGEAIAAFILRRYPQAARILVLAGRGNNGGDGLVAARLLAGEGIGIRVLLTGRQADLQGDAAAALSMLKNSTAEEIVEELTDELAADTGELADLFAEADLILDAVVGTGFKPPLRGAAASLRDVVADSSLPVVAVDLPSGWDADSQAESAPDALRADAVVTFTAPKSAHVFGHLTPGVFGPVVVANIGSPAEAVQSSQNLHWAGASKPLTERPRAINSNKGKFGHVLIVGGSFGTAGAPSMASLACLRAGAGLVTAAVPRSIVNLVAGVTPELMLRPMVEDKDGVIAAAALDAPDDLDSLTKGIKVIAVGPGLSMRGEASAFARDLVTRTTLPIVVDADALNAFDPAHIHLLDGRKPDGRKPDGHNRTLVITPHPGEFARLTGLTIPQVEADRIHLARSFATGHHLTLVLKGWRTLIAHPDGAIAVNTTGNPGLAKGGSGDILTGIVAAMLAQFPENVAEAVEAAVYLHGLAADCAVQHRNEKTLLATDVIAALTEALDLRTADQDGLEWLCGLRPRQPEQD